MDNNKDYFWRLSEGLWDYPDSLQPIENEIALCTSKVINSPCMMKEYVAALEYDPAELKSYLTR